MDPSAAADQPMQTADGNVVLTYNGEIYNFVELRRSLSSQGPGFSSSGDTEVALRAYQAWGAEFVTRIDGMFALAVWDAARGRLLLARDRAGKKPLFYALTEGRLSFASEIKALLTLPWIERRLDRRALVQYLTYGYTPHPLTMYAGIRQLPPASVLVYDGTDPPGVRRYWNGFEEHLGARRANATGTAHRTDQLRHVLASATRRRMHADVPMGALLSGGIDSAIVVGLMSQHAPEPVRTFCAGFADDPSFDERPYARLVSRRFATRHEEFDVRADAAGLLDRLLWYHDQPFADSSAIPTYLICELARQRVSVVLNGDGGDELFGGYDRFRGVALAGAIPAWPVPALRKLVTLLPRNSGYFSLRRRVERFIERSGEEPRTRYASWVSVMNDDLLDEILPESWVGHRQSGEDPLHQSYRRVSDLPVLDQVMLANFESYLPDDLAVKMDRMSMAHSLEARSPFLDTALIEHAAEIPGRDKVGLLRLKPILRQAFWPLLPRQIWNRRKHGFGVPMGAWLRHGSLRPIVEDELLSSSARTRQYLDAAVLDRMWREHLDGTVEHGFRFWALLTLERWLRCLERPVALAPPAYELTA